MTTLRSRVLTSFEVCEGLEAAASISVRTTYIGLFWITVQDQSGQKPLAKYSRLRLLEYLDQAEPNLGVLYWRESISA